MNEFFSRIAHFIHDFSWSAIEETIVNSVLTFSDNYDNILKQALDETLYMSAISIIIGFLLALFPAILLTIWDKDGIKSNKTAYAILDFITNILRAFPFLILIVVLLPLSKIIVGTSIGTTAAIVPISIGVAPYLAKMLESALKEVDKGVIEAAKSYGATNIQIIFKVIFVEALPNIISGVTLTLIFVIGFSALAGTVGGGGLGDVAIRYGYERFNTEIMIQTVVILLILVQLVQVIGNIFHSYSKTHKGVGILGTLALLMLIYIVFNIYNNDSIIWQVIIFIVFLLPIISSFLNIKKVK